MSDGPIWFERMHGGRGSARPVGWHGWVIIAIYAAGMIGITPLLAVSKLIHVSLALTLTLAFLWIVKVTTRGGWTWHDSGKD